MAHTLAHSTHQFQIGSLAADLQLPQLSEEVEKQGRVLDFARTWVATRLAPDARDPGTRLCDITSVHLHQLDGQFLSTK